MKRYFFIGSGVLLGVLLLVLAKYYVVQSIFADSVALTAPSPSSTDAGVLNLNKQVEELLATRQQSHKSSSTSSSLFSSNTVNVLLLGLDKRVGQTAGHCDVIQFVSIDKKNKQVTLTAVPRGTYSPLPPGKAVSSTDYYVSNACGLAGLEYGVQQIEKIAGQKADYMVVVGFSETLGILRTLHLPTTDTLQWLRRRRVYAVGEPQRAHNHSTFLKQLMTQYLPKEKSVFDNTLRYIIYKTVQTDLSFDQVNVLVTELQSMDLQNHPERIRLTMRPAYTVQDIPYTPEHLDVTASETLEQIQKRLLTTLEQKKENKEFVAWVFDNDVWLQVEDEQKRQEVHYDFLLRYVTSLTEKQKREELIADYILEMQYLGQHEWAQKGKELLTREMGEEKK